MLTYYYGIIVNINKLVIFQAGVACEARVSVWHDAATPIFLGEVRLQLRQTSPTPLRAW